MKKLTFAKDALLRPKNNKISDAYTTLNHYCQVNYLVPAEKLRKWIHPRFESTTIDVDREFTNQAIISAVIFQEKNFHFPSMKVIGNYTFSQTNYRTYTIDRETGQRTVWFFGTTLDHFSIIIPKDIWRFPWHKAKIKLETAFHEGVYQKYVMNSSSVWGEASLDVIDQGRKADDSDFLGFPDKETALIYLTQPMSGHFYLNKKTPKLGCWEIYHVPMNPNIAKINSNSNLSPSFKVFKDMGLIKDNQMPYNILLQNEIDYDIYLPPIESISHGSRYCNS
jgi:hypothetical protein